jgi:hypothetical protein
MAGTAGHGDRVCSAKLRRRLSDWSAVALLRRVHATLIRMVRSGPEAAAAAWDVVIDSCSVRAKRGGELTGPNPTDRAKRGLSGISCAAGINYPVRIGPIPDAET